MAGQLNECNRCSRPLSYRGRCELYDDKSYDVENPPHPHRQPAKAERMRKDERELPYLLQQAEATSKTISLCLYFY